MRRVFKSLLSVRAFSHLRYVPSIICGVKNWCCFLLNYVGLRDDQETYVFRDGLRDVFVNNGLVFVDLLKLDVEGAEFEILYSTPKKYLRRVCEIRLEYHNQKEKDYNILKLTSYLLVNGFDLVHQRKDSEASGIAWYKQNFMR